MGSPIPKEGRVKPVGIAGKGQDLFRVHCRQQLHPQRGIQSRMCCYLHSPRVSQPRPDRRLTAEGISSNTNTEQETTAHETTAKAAAKVGNAVPRPGVPAGSSPQGCSNAERGGQPPTLQESGREAAVPAAGPLHRPGREGSGHAVGDDARGSETQRLGEASWCQNHQSAQPRRPAPEIQLKYRQAGLDKARSFGRKRSFWAHENL